MYIMSHDILTLDTKGGILINPLSEATYLILLALYKEPLHGYGVIKKIEKISDGKSTIAPGTLYGVLKNLEKQGLITTLSVEKAQRKKKTYSMTEKGKEVFQQEYERYFYLIHLTQKLIEADGG